MILHSVVMNILFSMNIVGVGVPVADLRFYYSGSLSCIHISIITDLYMLQHEFTKFCFCEKSQISENLGIGGTLIRLYL